MHKEQYRQRHLKSNNIISKLVVIVLSIVLLTGISLVSVIQDRSREVFPSLPFPTPSAPQQEHYLVWLELY